VHMMHTLANCTLPEDDLRIETCRSNFKCVSVKLYKCICWLIIKVIAEGIYWETNSFRKENMECRASEGQGSNSEEDDEG